MQKLFLSFLLLWIMIFVLQCRTSSSSQIILTKDNDKEKPDRLSYWLYLPKGYSYHFEKYPLVLFLHGKGERGSDPNLLFIHGIPKQIKNGQDFPFLVLAPQLSIEQENWNEDELYLLLENIISKYKIDPDRIYLTGLSMGGNGVWKLAQKYPNYFAAIAPISGWGDVSQVCKLKEIPVSVFHGDRDAVVPPKNSIDMVERLKLCSKNITFTLYKDTGHDAWSSTYHSPEFYHWLLKQKRKPSEKKN